MRKARRPTRRSNYPLPKEIAPIRAAEERALIAKAQAGDGPARTRLLEAGIKWAAALAGQYNNSRNPELGDMIGEGILGLSGAIDDFDPSRSAGLYRYAGPRIRRSIVDYLRYRHPLFRAGARGNYPVIPAKWGGEVLQLDGDDFAPYRIPAATPDDPDVPGWLETAMGRLSGREREVIERSFGIGRPAETLAAIGRSMGIKEPRVSRLRSEALDRLRAMAPDEPEGKAKPAPPRPRLGPAPVAITAHGETRTIRGWADKLGLSYESLLDRKQKRKLPWPEVLYQARKCG